MNARDEGSPSRSVASPAQVTVDVVRNTAPRFVNTQNYQVIIDENLAAGGFVYRVTTTDGDRVVRIVYKNLNL